MRKNLTFVFIFGSLSNPVKCTEGFAEVRSFFKPNFFLMKIKILFALAFSMFLGQGIAQTEKTEKKVVIVKKTIDDNGNETVEKTILTGEDAANFDAQNEMDAEMKTAEKEEKKTVKKSEKQIRIMKFENDGDGEITPEMRKKLAEEGIDIDKILNEEGKNVWITEDDEEIEIDGEHKMIFIDKGEKETEIEKEIIIVDDKGKESKTRMKMQRKAFGADAGNTLEIKSLNINLDNNNLTINLETEAKPISVLLTDTDGEKIYREEVKKFDGKFDGKIDLTKAAAGPVFLIVKQGEKVFSERIVR